MAFDLFSNYVHLRLGRPQPGLAVFLPMKPEHSPDSARLELPIDGVLDLHTFRPEDLGDLVPAYLMECRARGVLEVRIIHGKGIGRLKRGVLALLGRRPEVVSFGEAGALFGGAGATIVRLRPTDGCEKSAPHGH